MRPLTLPATLLALVILVASSERRGTVRRREWVKHPYIKIHAFKPSSPHATRRHIQAGLILGGRRPVAEKLAGEGLEMRLYFYAVCHLLQLASDDVPYLIVAKRGETTGGARESMLNREGGTTDTSRREPCRVPAIPQCQTITKFTLRQAEPMPTEGSPTH